MVRMDNRCAASRRMASAQVLLKPSSGDMPMPFLASSACIIFGEIVRDENGRLLQSLKNLLQIFLQCCPNEWIERTERLVEEKKLRREGERAHEADALTLSAGKFGGKPIESLSWETGQCAQLIERDPFVQLTRHQQNISARSQVWEEATVLNDVADAMPKFGDVR